LFEHGEFRRRRLPHWDLPDATYFVTTCLAGSIPAEGLLEIARRQTQLLPRSGLPGGGGTPPRPNRWKQAFVARERWLDSRPAVRHLGETALAKIVADACYYGAGRRYDLLSYVVMPSHLHWVFRPREDVARASESDGSRSPRERIMHDLKRHTARQCNLWLGLQGTFWQDESYDRWIRDESELGRIIHYVESNPVKAGLVELPEQWQFSSAYDRMPMAIPRGTPLLQKRA
jgi:type I restriction enzyme R subunit